MTDTLEDTKNKVQILTSQNKDMQKQIANIEVSKNRFPFGWKYLGRGECGTADDSVSKQPATFTECVNFCERKRDSEGSSWNGFTYYASGQSCWCHKNDRGHNMNYTNGVHFRFE